MTTLICAECGKPILEIAHGMVEWIEPASGVAEVRIVHNPTESPLKPARDCYKHTRHRNRRDLHLHQVIEDRDLADRLGLSGRI